MDNLNDIMTGFHVVFGEDFVRVELIESLYLRLKEFQVFLRPLPLEIGIGKAWRG
jgi:hypothetical protein